MNHANAQPSFQQVYRCLQQHGPANVTSSRGTLYEVHAEVRRGQPTIVGYPRAGEVRIHEDCWGLNTTCQRTRAGGIFNGNPSIYDWYRVTCGNSA
jgi:hypothetical protein